MTDLKSIGLLLKKKREENSYTLEHVSEITRITLTNLRNIEEGNIQTLPGLVFVRGFIRNYAKLLGLESDWMIEALNQTYNITPEIQQTTRKETTVSESTKEEVNINFKFVSIGALTIAIALVGFIIFNNKPIEQFSSEEDKVETVQAVETQEIIESTIQDMAEHPPQAPLEAPPQTVTAIISPLTLTLVAKENEWIRLAIDGQDAFELQLKKGEKYDWPAEEEYALTMTTGNTASIHLNGEEIVDRENFQDQLFQVRYNKFTLKQINNR